MLQMISIFCIFTSTENAIFYLILLMQFNYHDQVNLVIALNITIAWMNQASQLEIIMIRSHISDLSVY